MALTDMVIMPGADYQGACDALRARHGTTGKIKSGEIAQLIEDIPSGGGADLPELTNPGNADTMLYGYQLLDQNGQIVTGEIQSRTADNVIVHEDQVIVNAGHYKTVVRKTVDAATQATPSITVSDSGLITAKATQSAGYVASGTKEATKQLTTKAGTTVTPTTAEQTIVTGGTYVTGDIKVAAVPEDTGVELPDLTNPGDASKLLAGYQLIDGDGAVVDGNIPTVDAATPGLTIQANGDVVTYVDQAAGYTTGGYKTYKQSQDVIPAQTIMPGTEDQVIPAYHYLTGKQTIKGDPNLVPENIPEDVVLFGVQGNRQMGSSAPAPEPESKDVDFYDYDGTRLYSYTLAEAQALTELPPLPSREGLVCQGWNWTLDEIKEWGLQADVGATYTTDDGSTRIYISVDSILTMPMTLYFKQTAASGVLVDWGDGTAATSVASTGAVSVSHAYGDIGEYVIRLQPVSGKFSLDNSYLFGNVYAHTSAVRHIEIGDSCTGLGTNFARNAFRLKTISLSESVVSGGDNMFYESGITAYVAPKTMTSKPWSNTGFYGCARLRIISIPAHGGSIASNPPKTCLQNCWSLRRVVATRTGPTIDSNAARGCKALTQFVFKPTPTLTQIWSAVFQDCYSLAEFVVPESIVEINSSTFSNCYSMRLLKFLPTTPPTVTNANAFANLPATCVVEVPADSLATYQAATNYSGIAAQMVGV